MKTPIIKIYRFKENALFPKHQHSLAQFGFPLKGVLKIEAANKRWLVPPRFALWIPSNFSHKIAAEGPVTILFIYVHEKEVPNFPKECSLYKITNLLRELILKANELENKTLEGEYKKLLLKTILHELGGVIPSSFHLEIPHDPRARKAAEYLIKTPSSKLSLAEIAKMVGAGQRTLSRLFIKETGLSFHKWRQRNKIFHAIPRLAENESVSSISYDLGYSNSGSFISMFKNMTGKTPGSFFQT